MSLRGACKSANPIVGMVHDTENYLFPRNSVVVPRRQPWIVVWSDADLLQGGHGSSVRADTNLPLIRIENGGNQKANFRHNNAEGIERDIARIVRIIIVGIGHPLIFPQSTSR